MRRKREVKRKTQSIFSTLLSWRPSLTFGKKNSSKTRTRIYTQRNITHQVEPTPYKIYQSQNNTAGEISKPANHNLKFQRSSKPVRRSKGFRSSSVSHFGQELWKQFKYFIVRWKIIQRFNKVVATLAIIFSISFVFYLSFFDTHFLVKTYTIEFAQDSFLSEKEVKTLTKSFSDYRFMGILPTNQYWFLNDSSLSIAAKTTIPNVESIEIIERVWPNQVAIKIHTEPILLTLAVMENNQKKYWRIDQNGNVLTEDTLNIRENVVSVDRGISFDKAEATLQNYPLSENQTQLNRFWFVIWLWQKLDKVGVGRIKTSFPSLLDTDVNIITSNNTLLLFDSASLSQDNQEKRIQNMFSSPKIIDEEKNGKISYIDFRIPQKIFVCYRGTECDK